jgi:hypothetical protein
MDRDATIVHAVTVEHRTLADVARQYGITRERVRQIVARDCPGFAVRAARTRLNRERRDRLRAEHDQRMQYWRDHVEPSGNRGMTKKWSDEDLLSILTEQTTLAGRPLSITDWRSMSPERGLPSAALYTMRFGSWNEAKRRAGLQPLESNRPSYTREFSDEEMIAAVAEFLRDAERGSRRFGSYHYAVWRESLVDSYNLPSLPLLRVRLGKWGDIKQAAIDYNEEHFS